jgi:proteic killer suppression protein
VTIQSFGDFRTEKIFWGVNDKQTSKLPPNILRVVERKLDMLEAAAELQDLASPPANRLEKLKGNMRGYWSIRVNDQWRIIFKWLSNGPHEVKITDYH